MIGSGFKIPFLIFNVNFLPVDLPSPPNCCEVHVQRPARAFLHGDVPAKPAVLWLIPPPNWPLGEAEAQRIFLKHHKLIWNQQTDGNWEFDNVQIEFYVKERHSSYKSEKDCWIQKGLSLYQKIPCKNSHWSRCPRAASCSLSKSRNCCRIESPNSWQQNNTQRSWSLERCWQSVQSNTVLIFRNDTTYSTTSALTASLNSWGMYTNSTWHRQDLPLPILVASLLPVQLLRHTSPTARSLCCTYPSSRHNTSILAALAALAELHPPSKTPQLIKQLCSNPSPTTAGGPPMGGRIWECRSHFQPEAMTCNSSASCQVPGEESQPLRARSRIGWQDVTKIYKDVKKVTKLHKGDKDEWQRWQPHFASGHRSSGAKSGFSSRQLEAKTWDENIPNRNGHQRLGDSEY